VDRWMIASVMTLGGSSASHVILIQDSSSLPTP